MNNWQRANLMPLWDDCKLELPPGVIPHRDGDIAALVYGPKVIGIRVASFDARNLPEILSRLGVSGEKHIST